MVSVSGLDISSCGTVRVSPGPAAVMASWARRVEATINDKINNSENLRVRFFM
jgi:hypothetical protein